MNQFYFFFEGGGIPKIKVLKIKFNFLEKNLKIS